MDLADLRKEIDAIDREIVSLLHRRGECAQKVGQIKNERGEPFYVPAREKEILERLTQMQDGPFPKEAIAAVYKEIISACLSLQKTIRVAYMGPEASYHHLAGMSHFGRSAVFVPVRTIDAVFTEVERHRADYGIAAIENSFEGGIAVTMDRFVTSPLRVIAEIYLPVVHALISHGDLSTIKRVYSHPQGLAQCRLWLERNLPGAELIETSSTTQGVLLCKDDPTSAAIAGRMASEIVGVPVKVNGIEDSSGNTTRFFVIGREEIPPGGDDKTALIIFIRDRVGALYHTLEPMMKHGINLTNLVSRPTRREAWQYMFFIELEGHIQNQAIQDALHELDSTSMYLKVLGSFPKGTHR
ncbi:MAG TPA: prephenate dehydratase [bacterium]|nr:prephenate dehydratase [bacterium]HQL63015.1 prephenate dehydratase [bacterium]